MASPFAMEEDSQLQGRPTFDPAAQPKSPAWYAGLGYDDTGYPQALNVLESGVLQGVAKGQAVLGGALHRDTDLDYSIDPQGGLVARDTGETPDNTIADAISADAKAKIKAFTPDANTTGAAAQILHGVVSGATEMAIGGLAGGPVGAGIAVGAGEGVQRYNELIDAGVDPATAREAAGVTSVAAGLGAFVPGGFGSSLVTKVVTGAAANTAFGMVNRYADHKVLENAGYDAMADQQKVIDSTQVLTDFILGAAFGGLAHLHSPEIEQLRDAPGARDAALTTNLALADRKAAPGIPADPEAANAHQDALQAGIESLIRGREVDVSESGVTGADFVARDDRPNQELAATVRESIDEHDLFGEDNARDVDALLSGGKMPEPEEVRTAPEKPEEGAPVEKSGAEETPGFRVGQIWESVKGGLTRRYTITEVSPTDSRRAKGDENAGGAWLHYDTELDNGWKPVDKAQETIQPDAESPLQSRLQRSAERLRARASRREIGVSPEGEREAGASNQDDTARILADRPDLTIPDENGNPIKASDALKAANEDLAIKTRESKIAAETAISCYLRRGN